jgi:hypothetical protein
MTRVELILQAIEKALGDNALVLNGDRKYLRSIKIFVRMQNDGETPATVIFAPEFERKL